jgi:hypothetical protein
MKILRSLKELNGVSYHRIFTTQIMECIKVSQRYFVLPSKEDNMT